MGAVEHHEGTSTHDLEPARHLERREGRRDDGFLDRDAEEGLCGGEGGGGVVSLVGPVERDVDLLVAAGRRVQIGDAAAVCEPVGVGAEVLAPPPHRRRAHVCCRLLDDAADLRILLAEDDDASRLHDARLLRRDRRTSPAEQLHVVEVDVRDHRDSTVDDVRGVPPSAEPDLDDGSLDGFVGEPAKRRRRHELEPGGPRADEHLQLGQRGQLGGKGVVGDGGVASRPSAR